MISKLFLGEIVRGKTFIVLAKYMNTTKNIMFETMPLKYCNSLMSKINVIEICVDRNLG